MPWFTITIGLLVRTFLLTAKGFSKMDSFKIGGAIFLGLYAAGKGDDLILLPLGFAAVIAFAYKDKIIPTITEGTVLLHTLVALFIFHKVFTPSITTFNIWLYLLLTILISLSLTMLYLCVSKTRIPPYLQVIIMASFLLVSSFIGYQTALSLIINESNTISEFLVGFYGLYIVSGLLYALYFIPIPIARDETFKMRINKIKRHAKDLDQKYIDMDIHWTRTIMIFGLVFLLILNEFLAITSWITAVILVLSAGVLLLSPKDRHKQGNKI